MSSYYDVDAILTDAQVATSQSSFYLSSCLHKRLESTMHIRTYRTRPWLPRRQHEWRCEAGIQS